MEKIVKLLQAHGNNVIEYGNNYFVVDNVYRDQHGNWETNRFIIAANGAVIEDVEGGMCYCDIWDYLGY